MFGLVAPTTEAMLVRSAYVQDNLMDGRVLAELQAPSQIDPMRSMTIKWAMRASSIFTRSFSRGRDFVFVESTGIVHMGEEGQRIGYHLVHSIPLAAIPSFERDHDVVRGHLSYCCLFRQKRRKAVELFMRGTFNLLGDVNATMAVAQTTETISTTMRYTYCAHMKKLAGFVRSSAATLDNALTTSVKGLRRLSSGSTCGACHRPSGAIRQKLCRICCKHVCSSCASPQKIASSVMRGGVPSIQQKRVHFCQNCVIASLNANAHTLAREEAFERYQAESDQEDEFAQGFDSPVSAWEMDQIPEESHLSWNSPANSNSDDEEFDNSSFRCHAFGW
ncbi:TPA: hypothetical protein N0F65_005083 [Lagenidium giganteum]|uniref:FYVE-type domain-containing protein n=1 Tax=Lagenidium giganteum TaxID=4803 RepID=A0AAV2YJL8_9STRA|nr:TPA: hypothetical protein N0F65_005083 [Lagenidium giganteum]